MVKLRDEQKAELIRQEKERRRIARLRQVRQQTATNAKVIREVVSRKKTQVIEEIKSQIHEQVEDMMTEQERAEIENNLRARLPRKTMTPRSKKRAARRREMTESDLALAQKRNADAMRRLRDQKKQEVEQREQRMAKRKEAAQKANEIMRGNQIL